MAADGRARRKYDGAHRRAQAERTRAELLAAARRLFLQRGYAATSVRDIAEEAGVAVQTLYAAFGSKARLFGTLVDAAVLGEGQPVPLDDRRAVRQVVEADDPAEVVRRFAHVVRLIWERFGELLPVLRSAAVVEPEVASEHRRNIIDNRYRGQAAFIDRVVELGGLREGLDQRDALDGAWTLTGPDVYEALVLQRAWPSDRYEAWLVATLSATLLRTPRDSA